MCLLLLFNGAALRTHLTGLLRDSAGSGSLSKIADRFQPAGIGFAAGSYHRDSTSLRHR
jgi:hypothetical protein